ncbi:MAG TPA: hypothetical protein V6C57_21685 [Coleofasciculaceae cyanobacterium]
MTTDNAKNQLYELLKSLGCAEACATFKATGSPAPGLHRATVEVIFPNGTKVSGAGHGQRVIQAEIAAAQAALEQVRQHHAALFVDWDEIKAEAQAGDALIKLGVYLDAGLTCASMKSERLQSLESDAHLAQVFDVWKSQGDLDLAMWGPGLGLKSKATLVEALLWKRFRAKVLSADAEEHFQLLLQTLAQQ